MKLDMENLAKNDGNELVADHSAEIVKIKKDLIAASATIQKMAQLIAAQKEEIAELRKESIAQDLKNMEEIRNLVLKLDAEFDRLSEITTAKNEQADDFDEIDLDFLAKEVANRLELERPKQQQGQKKEPQEISTKWYMDIKVIATTVAMIAGVAYLFIAPQFKTTSNPKNDKMVESKKSKAPQPQAAVKTAFAKPPIPPQTQTVEHVERRPVAMPKPKMVCQVVKDANELYAVDKDGKLVDCYTLKGWDGSGVPLRKGQTIKAYDVKEMDGIPYIKYKNVYLNALSDNFRCKKTDGR